MEIERSGILVPLGNGTLFITSMCEDTFAIYLNAIDAEAVGRLIKLSVQPSERPHSRFYYNIMASAFIGGIHGMTLLHGIPSSLNTRTMMDWAESGDILMWCDECGTTGLMKMYAPIDDKLLCLSCAERLFPEGISIECGRCGRPLENEVEFTDAVCDKCGPVDYGIQLARLKMESGLIPHSAADHCPLS